MFKFKTDKRRINWLYKTHCNTNNYSIEEFISLVNKYYYKHSSSLYNSRNIKDIEDQYVKMFNQLDLSNENQLNIINIGAGQGFDYKQFKKNKINYNKYFFIEPHLDMIKSFTTTANDDRLKIINKLYSESLAKEYSILENKVIIMNSCLHHFTQIHEFLDLIKFSMKKGDLFILCHEPNNTYNKSFLSYLAFTIKFFFTPAFLNKVGVIKNNESEASNRRWKNINNDLIGLGVLNKRVKPLVIRRIIDYGVNTKNDWKKLNIPDSYDEGHWTPKTIIDFFKNQYSVKFFSTYRHFGDANGNFILEFLNDIYSFFFSYSNNGSVFNIVLEKK